MIDWSQMSLAELREEKSRISKEIDSRLATDKAKAREQILQIAAGVGISVFELLGNGHKDKRAGKIVPAKYREPTNANNVWSGRGRQPKWVKSYLEKAGGKLEDLEIKA